LLSLYWHFIKISFRSQLQYKSSFLMLSFGHFISTFVDIFAIWMLFNRFKLIKGWNLFELMIIYGIIHMSFALAESLARGFDKFSIIIKYGDFDRILLRPLSSFFQIAASEVQLMRVGRFLQGLIVIIIGFYKLNMSFLSLKTLLILFSIIGSFSLFYGLFIIQATISFWTIETLELMNITTYGGVEAGQYPMNIYNRGFKLFFTFVIPLACVAYYPVATILKKGNLQAILGILAPLAGILFFIVAMLLWKLGVNHYNSTGN